MPFVGQSLAKVCIVHPAFRRKIGLGHSKIGFTFHKHGRSEWGSSTAPLKLLLAIGEKMTEKGSDDPVSMYELLEAIEAVIKAADPAKREALAHTIDAYADDFPDDFYWAVGPQAPTLLNHLLQMIDASCRPELQSKPRSAIRLVDRKPDGNA